MSVSFISTMVFTYVDINAIVKLFQELQNYYLRAENFMVKPEGLDTVQNLMPEINQCYDNLIELCGSISEEKLIPGSSVTKSALIKNKVAFDSHVKAWIERVRKEGQEPSNYNPSEIGSIDSTPSTSSSVRSEKQRSEVNVTRATAAKEQEEKKLQETILRENKELKKIKTRVLEDAQRKIKEAERLAEDEIEKARRSLKEKERDLELALVTANAWKESSKQKRSASQSKPSTAPSYHSNYLSPPLKRKRKANPEHSVASSRDGIASDSFTVSLENVSLPGDNENAHDSNKQQQNTSKIEETNQPANVQQLTREALTNINSTSETDKFLFGPITILYDQRSYENKNVYHNPNSQSDSDFFSYRDKTRFRGLDHNDDDFNYTQQKTQSSSSRKHVMISYSHQQKVLIYEIETQLKKSGYNVWIDRDQMQGCMIDAMQKAVENSAVFLMCMSKSYEESENCRREAVYATEKLHRNNVIPLIVEKGYRKKEWLEFVVSFRFYHDVSPPEGYSEKRHRKLMRELGNRGKK